MSRQVEKASVSIRELNTLKYGAENGNAAAARHVSKVFPGLGESIVRLFKKTVISSARKK